MKQWIKNMWAIIVKFNMNQWIKNNVWLIISIIMIIYSIGIFSGIYSYEKKLNYYSIEYAFENDTTNNKILYLKSIDFVDETEYNLCKELKNKAIIFSGLAWNDYIIHRYPKVLKCRENRIKMKREAIKKIENDILNEIERIDRIKKNNELLKLDKIAKQYE